jgi:hypothetical protein
MTSPKITLQTLAGFIPRPWSARAESSITCDRGLDDAVAPVVPPKPTLYVSKAKQLERLRERLQHENQFARPFGDDVCQQCDGAVVDL